MIAPAPPLARQDLDEILVATAPLWAEMRGERLFLTGGTGFFGCWLVESFLHANRELSLGAEVTVLTRDPTAFAAKCPHLAADSALTLHPGDVRNCHFPAGQFRFVIHAATEASAQQLADAPLEMLSTIVEGTRRVLDFAAASGTRKLLLTSSGAVYGRQPAELSHLSEDCQNAPDPLSAGSAYGEGKRLAELMCGLAARNGLECKVARCFAFVGPHLPLDTHFAAGNFLRNALAGEPIRIAGDGTAVRSYLYAADLAAWLWTMLFRAPSGRAFNVGSEAAVSMLELAQAVVSSAKPRLPIVVAQRADPGASVHRYVPSTARAQAELGLRQTVSLAEGLRRTVAWHSDLRRHTVK